MHRRVFGTALHFEVGEVKRVEQGLNQAMLCGEVTLADVDNLTILRRYVILG
jgi:hypothetical protein